MKYLVIFQTYLFYTLILGLVYPIIVFCFSALLTENRKDFSINSDGKRIGSEFISQPFQKPIYFSTRPSAGNYNTIPSGASNYSATSKKLWQDVEKRILDLESKWLNPDTGSTLIERNKIPDELKFASGSGLEPFLSYKATIWQVDFIAKYRKTNKEKIFFLVEKYREQPILGILGTDRVNIIKLNLSLDKELSAK